MPVADDDAALVLATRDGDEAAFGVLFERWSDRCFDVARRIVHDDGLAAEVTQETFLVAWRGLDTLRDPAAFGGWVLRTARNKSLNRLDREGRTRPVPGDAPLLLDRTDGSTPEATAEAAMTATELHDLVAAATVVLGERDASVLDLHLRHGLGAPEIAEELGVTTNNAHQLLFRMKKHLAAGIRAWVLVRGGRPSCDALAARLDAAGITSFSREAARAIDTHVAECEDCTRRQAAVLDPSSLFAAAPVVVMAAPVRTMVADGLRAAGVPMGESGADPSPTDSSGSTGASPPLAAGAPPGGSPPDDAPLDAADSGGRRRAAIVLALLAVLITVVIGAILLAPDDDQVTADDTESEVVAGTPETSSDDEGASATTTPASSTTGVLPGPGPASTTTTNPGGDPKMGSTTTTAPPSPAPTQPPSGTLVPTPHGPTTTTTTRPPTTTTTTIGPPSVDSFTAVTAPSPGGSCPGGQWATTLTWRTTRATTVKISAATVTTMSGLAADGSRVVCRPTPGSPPGGWSLTASGPGGTAGATA